jgi:predicted nuclease of predicted toxin-antitoxin system
MAAKKKKSTTRSATSLESLNRYTFFLDRALQSYALQDALKEMGARVEMHRDYFAEDAADVEWLPEVAERGWIILSKDQFNWLERQAILNANGRAFLLIQGSLPGEEQVSIICGAMRRILRILKSTPAPFLARIHRTRRVVIIPKKFQRW